MPDSSTITSSDVLDGADPFLTGVAGGSVLSNCSGVRLGPNETLFRLALGLS